MYTGNISFPSRNGKVIHAENNFNNIFLSFFLMYWGRGKFQYFNYVQKIDF